MSILNLVMIGVFILVSAGAMLISLESKTNRRNSTTQRKNSKPITPNEAERTFHSVARYERATSLLTPPEIEAFRDLARSVRGVGYVCPKVRIADLVHVEAGNDRSAFMSAFGKIKSKHVDFAVIKTSGEILFAVEIDDRSHGRPKRQERDALVNRVFEEAGIALVRIKPGGVASSDSLEAVIDKFRPKVATQEKAAAA